MSVGLKLNRTENIYDLQEEFYNLITFRRVSFFIRVPASQSDSKELAARRAHSRESYSLCVEKHDP